MRQEIKDNIEHYAEACFEEQKELLKKIGSIPAPSHAEEARSQFCYDWFVAHGAQNVHIDKAKNVICEIDCQNASEYVVFEAHMDIVFPDTEEIPVKEENGCLYAPGIGDDTANLEILLMCAKYLLENNIRTKCGLLLVANSCEEGLGNLDGTKEIFAEYGSKIKGFYSFDGHLPYCCNCAVGSYRYEISCHTVGGHSYADFGAPNAIEILCDLVEKLYAIKVPSEEKTTFNVGFFEGGTTVNSIAQKASILYEYRSPSQNCLDEMEKKFREAIDEVSRRDGEINVKLSGVRPGNGVLDEQIFEAFTAHTVEVISMYCDGKAVCHTASTDSNIPLSLGIPANTVGLIRGGGAHTREEWMELSSLTEGLEIALTLIMDYAVMQIPICK